MPRTSLSVGYTEPAAVGPIAQCDLTGQIPASIPAGGSFDTGIVYANGYKSLCAAVKMSQAGTITISRFLDAGGQIPAAAAATQAVTANTAALLAVNDAIPFLFCRIQIANSGGAAAAVAASAAFLNAN